MLSSISSKADKAADGKLGQHRNPLILISSTVLQEDFYHRKIDWLLFSSATSGQFDGVTTGLCREGARSAEWDSSARRYQLLACGRSRCG